MKRRHAPIEQLREASKVANQMLVERGLRTKDSTVDRILKENKIVLPGIPAYLPHRWTLRESRRHMKDILKLWAEKCGHNEKEQEKTSKFFKFLVQELGRIENEAKIKVDDMPKLLLSMKGKLLLSKVFSPWQLYETTQAMTRFMIDSFAVSMVVKEHKTTTGFAEWFMDWTQSLEDFWESKEKKDG